MDFEKFDLLSELVKVLPSRKNELIEMIECAFTGTRINEAFVLRNAEVYSELDGKSVLAVISSVLLPSRKDITAKAVEIVGCLRRNKIHLPNKGLLSVLGTIKPPSTQSDTALSEEYKISERESAAWDSVYSSIPQIDISAYDLSDEASLDECISAINARCDKVRAKVTAMLNTAKDQKTSNAAHEEVRSENSALREAWLSARINVAIKPILQALAPIYSECFSNPPMGVLTQAGVRYAASDCSVRLLGGDAAVLSPAVYRIIVNSLPKDVLRVAPPDQLPVECDGQVHGEWFNSDGTCLYNYAPKLQAHMIAGVYREDNKLYKALKWQVFESKIREAISRDKARIYRAIFKPYSDLGSDKFMESDAARICDETAGRLRNSLLALYTTTLIAEEISAGKSIRLRLRVTDVPTAFKWNTIADNLLNDPSLGIDRTTAAVMNNEFSSGTAKILIVLNKAEFTGETLFMYQAVQRIFNSGNKIDMSNVVLGRKLNGDTFSVNYADSSAIINVIQAGARSGKGVLTLGIAGAILGSGAPLIYLDFKPDMSALFWEYECKYGCRALSVDGSDKEGRSTTLADGKETVILPVRRSMPYNVPAGMNKIRWKAMAYAKIVMLYCLLAGAKTGGKISRAGRDSNFYAVFDEAQVASEALSDALKYVSEEAAKEIKDYNKQVRAANGDSSAIAELDKNLSAFARIYLFLDSLSAAVLEFKNAFPVSGCKIFLLGQDAGVRGDKWGKSGLATLFQAASNRLLGNDNADKTWVTANGGASVPGVNLITKDTPGHFAFLNANRGDSSMALPVFKSYMTLNENDYNPNGEHGEYVKNVLLRIKDETVRQNTVNEHLYPNGALNTQVGFFGLVEYIASQTGTDVTAGIERGYALMEQTAALVGICGTGGIYSTLEDWAFDCSPESFWSWAELSGHLLNGTKVRNTQKTLSSNDFNGNDFSDNFNENKFNEDSPQENVYQEDSAEDVYSENLTQETAETDDEFIDEFDTPPALPIIDRFAPPPLPQGEYNGEKRSANPSVSVDNAAIEYKLHDSPEILNIPDAPILPLNDENSIDVNAPSGANDRYEDSWRRPEAAEAEISRRLKSLLSDIAARFGGAKYVTKFAVYDNKLYVNNKFVDVGRLCGGLSAVAIDDLIDVGEVLRKYKKLTQIQLDADAREQFESIRDAVPQAYFGLNSTLGIVKLRDRKGVWDSFTRAQTARQDGVQPQNVGSEYSAWGQIMAANRVKNNQVGICAPGKQLAVWRFTHNRWKTIADRKRNPIIRIASAPIALAGTAVSFVTGIIRLGRSIRKN